MVAWMSRPIAAAILANSVLAAALGPPFLPPEPVVAWPLSRRCLCSGMDRVRMEATQDLNSALEASKGRSAWFRAASRGVRSRSVHVCGPRPANSALLWLCWSFDQV